LVTKVDRSDEVDGEWEVYDLTRKSRLKMCGQITKGLREGEWLVYEETSKRAPVHRRGPGARGRWLEVVEPVATFELLRIERYQDGHLVEST
jgi:hypothetical protein